MKQKRIDLPKPKLSGNVSIAEALFSRRTIREFTESQIALDEISQLLWAMQGTTQNENAGADQVSLRTAPSAGRVYPLVIYVLSNHGLCLYRPQEHTLLLKKEEDLREELAKAALAEINREAIRIAPLTVIVAFNNQLVLRITPVIEDALRFTYLETGHAAQNLILQACALGLGTCTITSYKTGAVCKSLALPWHHQPIYLIPVGTPTNQITVDNRL